MGPNGNRDSSIRLREDEKAAEVWNEDDAVLCLSNCLLRHGNMNTDRENAQTSRIIRDVGVPPIINDQLVSQNK